MKFAEQDSLRIRHLIWPLAVLFLHQALTGWLLSLQYVPDIEIALGSLRYLEQNGLGGVRSAHRLGSVALYFYSFFLLAEITVKRIHYLNSKVFTTFIWVYLFTFALSATGQMLPGNSESLGASSVAYSLLSKINSAFPSLPLVNVIYPYQTLASGTVRYYGIHTIVFPLLLLGLIIRLYYHREIYTMTENSPLLRLQRYSRYLALPAVLSLIAYFMPAPLEMPADLMDKSIMVASRLELIWLSELMNYLSNPVWLFFIFPLPLFLLYSLPWFSLYSLTEKSIKLFLALFMMGVLILSTFGYIRRENAQTSMKSLLAGKELFDSGECSDCHTYRPGTYENSLPPSYLSTLKAGNGNDFIDVTYAHRIFDKKELMSYIENAPAWAKSHKRKTKMPSFEGYFTQVELDALAEFIMNIRALPMEKL